MNSQAVMALIRHLLTLAGGVLITKGYTDENTVTQAIGAASTLIGFAWSLWHKAQEQK